MMVELLLSILGLGIGFALGFYIGHLVWQVALPKAKPDDGA
jgi:uncharacterized protein YneF (UPF0154 family)